MTTRKRSDTTVKAAATATRAADTGASGTSGTRATYAPDLERISEWSALALQRSVGTGPGNG